MNAKGGMTLSLESYQHLPKGAVSTLRDDVLQHPLSSIQHTLKDPGVLTLSPVSLEDHYNVGVSSQSL